MKKTKALGATYCFGGVHDFYTAVGFETICHREMWKRSGNGTINYPSGLNYLKSGIDKTESRCIK